MADTPGVSTMNSSFQRVRAASERLLAKLQRHFSPTRLLRTRTELLPLREGGRQTEWVIARSLSLFIAVPCAAVPHKRRTAFVATAVRRAAPFPDPAWHTAWGGDVAMVWVWPVADLVAHVDDDDLQVDAPTVRRAQRFMPESLLRGEPHENGVELVACAEGVEARAWRKGAMYASHWWPQMPDTEAWTAFCRGAGVAPQALPELQATAWREQPWTISSAFSLGDTLAQYQKLALPAAVVMIALTAAWQISALARVQLARAGVNANIAASSQKVADILAARNRAEDDLAATRQLLALRPPAPQIQLMATAAKILDPLKARVVQWSMPNPTTLELVVAMGSPDPRALVLAFQQVGLFDDVNIDIGRGDKDQVILHARIHPRADVAPTASAAAVDGNAQGTP